MSKAGAYNWENKYFSLLERQEALKENYQQQEALLTKAVVYLSQALNGVNEDLDPHLSRIRKHLKGDINSGKLQQELENFTKAMMVMDESSNIQKNPDIGLLVDLLIQVFPNRQSDLKQIGKKFQKNKTADLNSLLLDLHSLVSEEKKAAINANVEQTSKKLLNQLLAENEIPQYFNKQAHQLRSRLLNPKESLPTIIEETLALLIKINQYNSIERKKLTEFFAQLTGQLADLGQKAESVSATHLQSFKKRTQLNQSFSRQMQALQQSSTQATQLEPFKDLVISSLESINEQLRKHQLLEQKERKKNQDDLRELLDKVQHLEEESRQLKNKLDIAEHNAIYDALSGLPNRLAYDERLKLEIARMKRKGGPLSMIIWDIDLFKSINDSFGHKAGDKALKIIAKILKNYCRDTDFVSRFGGEEFIMLLPDSNSESALILAERVRKLIAETKFSANGQQISITVSAGVSEFNDKDNGDSVFKRADGALYQAKRTGRNRCAMA